MLQIGQQIPRFRALGLVQGELCWVNSGQLIAAHWAAFCFIPQLSITHLRFLSDYSRSFEETGTRLLIVAPDEDVLCHPQAASAERSQFIILEDPIQRLRRVFGVDHTHIRCTTFVIDPNGIFQIPLVHDLDSRGLDAALELVKAYQCQDIVTVPHAGEPVHQDAAKKSGAARIPEEASSHGKGRNVHGTREEETPSQISHAICTH